jgi:PAS domain S-box-containing protein
MVGYSRQELLGRPFEEITLPEDRNLETSQFPSLTRGKIGSYSAEKRYICRDGRIVFALVTRIIQHDEAGNPLYSISIVQDITNRKRTEKAL